MHAIEPYTLDSLPGRKDLYAGREALAQGLDDLRARPVTRGDGILARRTPIPYLARVDAGTVESIRRRGVEVVSSGDLVQRFAALLGRRRAGHAP